MTDPTYEPLDEPTVGIGHNSPPVDHDFIRNVFFDENVFLDDANSNTFDVGTFIANCGDLDKCTAAQIAHLFTHVKAQYDQLDAAKKEMSKFIELIKCVKLPEAFDKEDIKTFTLGNGTRVTKSDRTFVKCVGEQADVFSWLRDNGYPDVIKETANSSSLGAIAREVLSNTRPILDEKTGEVIRLEAKDPDVPIDMPDDLFKVTILPTTSVVRKK